MPHTFWQTDLVKGYGGGASSGRLTEHGSSLITWIVDRFGVALPLLVAVFVVLAIKYHNRLIFTPPARDGITEIPGALPLIGHTHNIVKLGTREQFHRFQELAYLSPTRCYRLTFAGAGSILMLNRPEYLEYVQKTNFENFPKGFQFADKLGDLLGLDGIFVADGDVWKTQRKMASHMFSANKFNTWVRQVVHNELDQIDSLLETVASQNDHDIGQGLYSTAGTSLEKRSGTHGGAIAMPELFFRYTLSSFAKMAFAADLGCLSEDPVSLQKPHPFAVAFDYAQGVMNDRFVFPIWKLSERIMPYGREMRRSIKTVRTFGMAIIKQRLAETGADVSSIQIDEKDASFNPDDLKQCSLQNEGKDLLALFMEQTQDPQALLTVVLNFLIAGRDTTAQTLSWLFYELCAHPEHVEHIRRELDQVMGKDAASKRSWLKYDEFKKLPYTLACVHEAARLHPSVPKNGKEVLRDDVIVPQGPNPDNLPPIKVYAGERVGWSDWVMNRLTEVWGPDAEEFNPQRFLTRDASTGQWSYQQQSQWKFHVFNAGPRLCLGMNLAGYEATAFLAATLQKYDFTWSSKQQGQTSDWPPTYANSVTHPMKDLYQVIVTHRQL
jgi:cytochrome P450